MINQIQAWKSKPTKKLPTNRSPGPNGFMGKFYQTIRANILLKIFQKISEVANFPNSTYETIITLIPKPDKDTI